MDSNKPRVSIGMPVYNGEKYISKAIDSIICQTYPDFVLIISDNASTDRTHEICLEYLKADNRIKYFRNKKNIGGPNNYNRVFGLSQTEFFKWAAYDDVLAPDFLKKCINILDKYPNVVGCHCKTGRIDWAGNFLGYYNDGLLKHISSPNQHERFRDLIGLYYTTTPFHGVYRSSVFARSQLHGTYIGADRNLVAELSLFGPIYEIPECLFFWREHPDSYTSIFYGKNRKYTLDRLKSESAWWSHEGSTYFPHWKNCSEYFKSINRVEPSLIKRLQCRSEVFKWFFAEGKDFMARDFALFMLQHSMLATQMATCLQKLRRYV
jgi:glycosyltransferase involved in cell wall biosynthesis